MPEPVVIIGIGEMGAVFARGLLRNGHPVFPITRLMDIRASASEFPAPGLVLMSVGEEDLHPVLEVMPEAWRPRVAFLQNELLPRDWEQHQIQQPTVISVWFEKKRGQDTRVLLPSPVYGPGAPLLKDALERIHIPCRELVSREQLVFELVLKNLYILTTNIAGIQAPGNVAGLWQQHRELALEVAGEVLDVQAALVDMPLDRQALLDGFAAAISADPEHGCRGRSAPARLKRTLSHAQQAGVAVPALQRLQDQLQSE
ncbi:MAG: hypothetical protein LJE84_02885 [Gammaproteobacteria bacterium]|nr:hypothetical protein [Gammaproteobacteria bacterium]